MTKTKSTKRALLLSALSLLLCVSMLIGTTFAWFTDSVSSVNNIIKSGNLDVELEYYDGDSWEKVTSTTNVFEQGTLWEPGHTEVVYLKITNAGTLALKYNLGVNIAKEVESISKDGNKLVLSDYIEFAAIEGVETPYADRAAARAAVTDSKILSTGYTLAGEMEPKAPAKYVALVVYMPESVGNEANYRTGEAVPQIDLGINLMAAQQTFEADSFNNEYDKGAQYPIDSLEKLQTAINNAVDGDVIQFTSDLAGELVIPQKPNVKFTLDGNGHQFVGSMIVDGKSGTILSAGVTIQNVKFVGATDEAVCINLGKSGDNSTRYTCNVTVKDCTFDATTDADDVVAIKSYTGGDKNLTVTNCTVSENMHSLGQLKNVDGILVEKCTVNAIRGISFNNSLNVKVVGSTFDVDKYAIRFGQDANTTVENYEITDCTITSQNGDGDAAIVLRAGATNANLTITNTAINAAIQMSGHTNANVTIIP